MVIHFSSHRVLHNQTRRTQRVATVLKSRGTTYFKAFSGETASPSPPDGVVSREKNTGRAANRWTFVY
jgi:hypothetical protein